MSRLKTTVILSGISLALLILLGFNFHSGEQPKTPKALVGAYYFDGWAGQNKLADSKQHPWAKNAPTHLTKRMAEEFSDREPIWGWRDDSLSIMERQIDLAADHGISFFSFCWYWHDDSKKINRKAIDNDSKHTGLNLFDQASNRDRLKFCLMISNHAGFKIKGTENWKAAAEIWLGYFKSSQYLLVDGKPLVIIYDGNSGSKEAFSEIQKMAVRAGFKGVTFAGCGKYISSAGFTYQTNYNISPESNHDGRELQYSDLENPIMNSLTSEKKYPYIPVITSGWNRQPWEGHSGRGQKPVQFIANRNPEMFGEFLKKTILWMDKNPELTAKERIVMIYAWNEFGEGGYIAPTKGDPDGKYLKAIRDVVYSG